MADKKPVSPVWSAIKPFVNGGASGMLATCIIQPIDMVKVYADDTWAESRPPN
jgi:solute carrier family 25 oxoglutarate transporter 11